MKRVDVQLLGGFRVEVDSREVPAEAWEHGRATQLVKLLALSPRHRMDRDRVVEALWSHLEAEAGVANLHKAASYARKALGDRTAIVLRRGQVELAPEAEISTDVERFEAGEEDAYGGELLPDDRYEEWAREHRERLRARRLALLQERGRWEDVLAEDSTNEEAHRALMRVHAEAGDRAAAVRRFRRLRQELAELGLTPEPETRELLAELSGGPDVRVELRTDAPLVGRDRELRVIERALERADAGRGGLLTLIDDSGIGKTRLAEWALAAGAERGWHTLRGAPRPETGPAPYGPVLEALEPLLGNRPDLLSHLDERASRTLGAVFPAARQTGGDARAALSRQEVLASVGELAGLAAGERGVMLCLEDMHASDEATLGLVQYLARLAREIRMLIVICLRSGQERPEVAQLRSQLARERVAADIALGPLDSACIAELVEEVAGRRLSPATVGSIERSSAGNPFFVEELAATVDADGEVTVPDHLHEILDAHLERLDAAASGFVPSLAVLEDPFEVREVASLAAVAEENALDALQAAARAGVLEPAAGDDAFSFRHPLLRDAARRRIPVRRLAEAHADVAAKLSAEAAPPERIAHHLLGAGRSREAVPLLAEATRWAISVAAFGEGLQWVEEALHHADDAQRPELLAMLAELRDRTGDPRAPADYEQALGTATPERRPTLRVKQARAYLAAGDVGSAARAIGELDLEGADAADRARAMLTRGWIAWHWGEMDEARGHSDQAARLCRAADLGDEATEQEDLAAMVAHADGQWAEHVRRRLSATWDLPEVAGGVYDAYLCVTEYVVEAGEPYGGLRAFASQLRAHARRAGARRGEAFATTVLGEAELLSGNPEVAREHLAEAARISHQVRATGSESVARARLGEAMLQLGDRDRAAAQLEQALGLAYHSALAPHLLPMAHGLAVRVPSDPSEAMRVLDRAESILDEESMCKYCRVSYYVPAASACAAAGELARGWDFVSRAERAAGLWDGWTPWSAAVAQARGELLLAEERAPEAGAEFRRAIEGFAGAGQRFNEDRAREALAGLT